MVSDHGQWRVADEASPTTALAGRKAERRCAGGRLRGPAGGANGGNPIQHYQWVTVLGHD